jgi:hypothetical protein
LAVASGPLIAGLLARYEPDALTLAFAVFLCALVFGAIAVALAPEGHPPLHFIAAYMGLSIPVLGLGIALHYVSPRMTLLIFALIVAVGILAAAPLLVRPPDTGSQL